MAFHLMIVDDSPGDAGVHRPSRGSLRAGRRECLQASNGQEALDLLRANWVDIVLTDINMPVMNGEEFVRRMEQDEMLRTMPVLVVSTDGSENRVQRMMSLGAKGYVKKPFSPELLRTSMTELLGVAHD